MPKIFLDPLDVRDVGDGKNWMTLHEFRYATKFGRVITVPAGFITDFASIPWIFRRMFQPATGKHRRGAVIHDWLYRTSDINVTREYADKIFLEIMELDGTPGWKRQAMYRGVRLGGSGSFVSRDNFED